MSAIGVSAAVRLHLTGHGRDHPADAGRDRGERLAPLETDPDLLTVVERQPSRRRLPRGARRTGLATRRVRDGMSRAAEHAPDLPQLVPLRREPPDLALDLGFQPLHLRLLVSSPDLGQLAEALRGSLEPALTCATSMGPPVRQ